MHVLFSSMRRRDRIDELGLRRTVWHHQYRIRQQYAVSVAHSGSSRPSTYFQLRFTIFRNLYDENLLLKGTLFYDEKRVADWPAVTCWKYGHQ